MFCLQVASLLEKEGIDFKVVMVGEGRERKVLEKYIVKNNISQRVEFKGNVPQKEVMNELIQAHFLLFASKSEGWPKAVAEAMWWGCIPITTLVSCVPFMLGNGIRGELIEIVDDKKVVTIIQKYLTDPDRFIKKSKSAMDWSRQYNMERFETEIKELL